MSDLVSPVRLSQLVNMVAQEGPPVPGNRVKLNFFHEPRIRGIGITGDDRPAFDQSLGLDTGELVIARDRGRCVWQYTGTVLVDIEPSEARECAREAQEGLSGTTWRREAVRDRELASGESWPQTRREREARDLIDAFALNDRNFELAAEVRRLQQELADLRAAHGYSNDNSPALGGQKEERP